MYCTHCGTKLPSVSRFCVFCGKPVASAIVPAVNTAPPAPAAPAPVRTSNNRTIRAEELTDEAKVKRAFNLSTASTMLTFGVHSMITTALLIVLTYALLLIMLFAQAFIQLYEYGADAISNGGGSYIIDGLSSGNLISWLNEHNYIVLMVMLIYVFSYSVGMLIGILVSKTVRKRIPAMPPEKRKLSFPAFLMIALIAFGMWGAGVLIGSGPSIFMPPSEGAFSVGLANLPNYVLAVVGAPLFEELIFRKFMLDRLAPYGSKIAVFFSALAFGMAHQNGMQFFLAFFLGLLFAAVYLYTGKIIYTMLLHGMINFFAVLQELGAVIFGTVFHWIWVGVAGVLIIGGIIMFIVKRKHEIFRLPDSSFDKYAKYAVSGWAFTVAKILITVSIVETGLLYTIIYLQQRNFITSASLLVSSALAIAVIFVLPIIVSSRIVKKAAALNATMPVEAAAAAEPSESGSASGAPCTEQVATDPDETEVAPGAVETEPATVENDIGANI